MKQENDFDCDPRGAIDFFKVNKDLLVKTDKDKKGYKVLMKTLKKMRKDYDKG